MAVGTDRPIPGERGYQVGYPPAHAGGRRATGIIAHPTHAYRWHPSAANRRFRAVISNGSYTSAPLHRHDLAERGSFRAGLPMADTRSVTELGFVFEEYRAAIEHMGATDAAIIAAPPSDLEFARLADYLDGHVPDQLIEWFQLCNGPIPATGGRDALMLFPWWYSYSLSFLLDNVERLARRFDQIEEGPIPQRPFPVLLDDRQTGGMWIECARSDGRLVYCDELEFCGTHDGYYHDSLDAFVGGCLTNLHL